MNKPSDAAAPRPLFVWSQWTPGGPGLARAALRRAVTGFGLCEEAIDDAVMAASELVANATEHATGPYEIALRYSTAALICEVVDRDPRIPVIPAFPVAEPFGPDPGDRGGGLAALSARLSERGRGLHIVNHLTGGAWGFRLPGDGTKVAWMAVRVDCPALRPLVEDNAPPATRRPS